MAIYRILTCERMAGLASFLGRSPIFRMIDALSPLYTSNLNVCFLHALAKVGSGFLNLGWTANPPEAMPILSFFVYVALS